MYICICVRSGVFWLFSLLFLFWWWGLFVCLAVTWRVRCGVMTVRPTLLAYAEEKEIKEGMSFEFFPGCFLLLLLPSLLLDFPFLVSLCFFCGRRCYCWPFLDCIKSLSAFSFSSYTTLIAVTVVSSVYVWRLTWWLVSLLFMCV